ncbi:MAG: ribonuclease R [Saprospiraceae bacterium]
MKRKTKTQADKGQKASHVRRKKKTNNADQTMKRLPPKQLQQAILKLFSEQPKKRFNPRQILKKLHVANNKDSIQHALEQLVEQGKLRALEDFKFKLVRGSGVKERKKVYEGFVDVTRSGSAYIECEDLEDDVFVAQKNLGTALHGDRVEVAVWWPRGRKRPEGEVIKVLERATDRFVGTFYLRGEKALVVPTRDDVPFDIEVDPDEVKDAAEGEKVVVKITDWGGYRRPAKGKVTAVLGMEGNDLEMNTILINAGFDLSFPDEVLAESDSLPAEISEEEISKRRDFRKVTTFTIDPADAKDFDDALSVRFLDDGSVEVGVHIADVTHYVRPGTALDKEAFHRSTSVYLVDRVIPMLPERLSNNLCSLRPHEDKLTFSAVFLFSPSGKIVKEWFGKTIIHSDHRFSYEEAQEVIEAGEGDYFKELKYLNDRAKLIRKKRFENGAIDFNVDEVRFRLDEDGVPVEAYVKDRKDAHMLIEEFMLLANKQVATYIHKKGKGHEIPFVYRIHDYPNPEKVAELARFALELGYKMKVNTPKEIAASYNKLIEEAEKNPALKLLEPLAIRTMAKAEYSTNNIGHYGLAFDNYTHFTSPIRRYADVLVHRILFENLGPKILRVDKETLEEQCKHISLQERKAMDAERKSIKYKQVEFMQKHIGESFTGFVSGIIDRGFFVELEDNKCEGMVPFETLPEPFEVEEGRLKAVGLRSGRVIKMGDRVRVSIFNADLAKRQIDMRLDEEEYPEFNTFGRESRKKHKGASNRRKPRR